MSGVAQWPSHRASSLATQLIAKAAASMSLERQAQWQSHRAPSVGTQLQVHLRVLGAAVSTSMVAEWKSHRVPSAGTQETLVAMSMSMPGPSGLHAAHQAS